MKAVVRASQLAKAQSSFRDRMRQNGYQRLQEWIPEDVFRQLGALCKESGLSRREAIESLVAAAKEGKINLRGGKT
ncbi:hypothetical protein F2P45_14960 [Massilia sp. CCM 8733]|uniref:Ribbon-helix-helix protein CopG domain-containing protein n=1 Tax=Massilia mucilaginosa TaxID=2609282 RepID=A0ABX0NTY6_9BURK|nr:hypothetical protein [Massilia mucilaginosa]NHZ90307.1 hypothetical protein [Massilia mucilaginosa]